MLSVVVVLKTATHELQNRRIELLSTHQKGPQFDTIARLVQKYTTTSVSLAVCHGLLVFEQDNSQAVNASYKIDTFA